MSHCDMIVLFVSQGIAAVLDTYSTGRQAPHTDKQQDIKVTSYIVNSTEYSVRFSRQLNTGDSKDQVLALGQNYTFCIAWSGASHMNMHSSWYNFDVTFNNNVIGVATIYAGRSVLYYLHAIILFIAWGIVADFGIIIARFFKSINSYLWIHAICFWFVDLATVALIVLMLVIDQGGNGGNNSVILTLHTVISVVLLILIIVEHIMGVVIKYFLESKTKKNWQVAFTRRLFHIILGTFMFLAAKVDMILGCIKNEETVFLILAIIWTVLLLVVRVGLEIYKSMNSQIHSKIQPLPHQILTTDQEELVKLLQENRSTNDILQQLPNIQWVLLNQDIYDMTNYQHPGGNFILSNVNGKEISRYFYGAFQLESTTMKAYTHSQLSYATLRKRYIGTIENSKYSLTHKIIPWISEEVKLSKNISIFYFTNNTFSIKLQQSIQDFGQHFSISLQEVGGKIRMYTKVLCMSKPYQQFREEFIEYHQNNQAPDPKLPFDEINVLPLIIKKYDFPNALSKQIFLNKENFWILGPFGRGLEIKQSSKCIAFVGGTGLLPFLDLLDHL